jgi:hypothetical protein
MKALEFKVPPDPQMMNGIEELKQAVLKGEIVALAYVAVGAGDSPNYFFVSRCPSRINRVQLVGELELMRAGLLERIRGSLEIL